MTLQSADPEIYSILLKDLGLASSSHFVYDFSSLMLYSIKWSIVIVWLPLYLEILGNICIVIICCLVCNVMNSKINHSLSRFFT